MKVQMIISTPKRVGRRKTSSPGPMRAVHRDLPPPLRWRMIESTDLGSLQSIGGSPRYLRLISMALGVLAIKLTHSFSGVDIPSLSRQITPPFGAEALPHKLHVLSAHCTVYLLWSFPTRFVFV